MQYLIHHFKKLIYLLVFTVFSAAYAGSYDDFFTAIKRDEAGKIQNLLARGFDANTLDPQGNHGLYLALREPSLKVAQALLAAPKLDVNVLNAKGESPLMIAALRGHEAIADALVKKGADLNKTGWTPLHYAASAGQTALIALFLENSAYIDAESPNGTTPLMMAAMYGSPEAVKLLLAEGADPQLKNQQGLTALQFAERGNRKDAAEMIAAAIKSKQPPGRW